MIPTRHKSPLSKALTWPLGAQAISAALVNTPHVGDLALSFSDSPVWPASEFQRLLRESAPYAILVAEYWPALKPGYSGPAFMVGEGRYKANWELRVNPVPRPLRSAAGSALREHGLPQVAEWLRSSGKAGWVSHSHCLKLVFAPADGTLTPLLTDGV
ncbi:MAG TPA: hypothetical protein DDY78_13990 [Planctomycetales bacterium]|jgi:hypothetical protein|nr:hypothetical protein [Planctomycetales bacterium]